MRFGLGHVLVLCLVLTCGIGCLQGASPQTVVQQRATNELSCPKEKLQVQQLGGTSFKATGCGMTATYTCLGGNFASPYDAICTREGNVAPVSGPTATGPPAQN
jgi:hypothetical protein